MTAVDTNILIYIQDPRDVRKQSTAVGIVKGIEDGVLLWQVANEYFAASCKLAPFGYSAQQAFEDISRWRQVWTTRLPNWRVMDKAEESSKQFNFSIWGPKTVRRI